MNRYSRYSGGQVTQEQPPARQVGDLEIVSEVTMAAIPRGDEELRMTFTKARSADGKDLAWHSLRVFWKAPNGEWKPGKQGVTIRGKELRAIADAFAMATSGGQSVAPPPEPLPDEVYAAMHGRTPR